MFNKYYTLLNKTILIEIKDYNIHIVGAGISGLVAAIVLEQNGYSPILIEATDKVGGRVKTDIVDGYRLDHGFQVLLTASPAAKKYLDFEALDLQHFLPGACIFKEGKQKIIGDPFRNVSLLFSTIFSGIGTFSDKIKILKLNKLLKKKSIDEIFAAKEKSTSTYLMDLGFSFAIINDFFKPFFSGIFLESKLETSSRMFEFIYKMFGEGHTAIPKLGMAAIPEQLLKKLKHSQFKYNTKVTQIKDGEIVLSNGEKLESHFTIVATDASSLIPNLKNQAIQWKSCQNLYFETDNKVIKKPLIALIPDNKALINNIYYSVNLDIISDSAKSLLSVTVVDSNNFSTEKIIEKVKKELKNYCGINSIRFIKHYDIPMSLPVLNNLQYEMLPSETRLSTGVFLAGDTQLNGSLNAAIISGEKAALGVIQTLG